MNIHEAAKLAQQLGTGFYTPESPRILIIPTNTQAGCLMMRLEWKNEKPGVRWQPHLKDLLREDWLVDGNPDESLELGNEINDST